MLWSSRLSIGVPVIDQQHQELFRRLEILSAALDGGDLTEVRQLLKFLEQYVVLHFTLEEEEMADSRYPDYVAHKRAHDQFIERLGKLRQAFDRNGATAWLGTQLRQLVIEWLKVHIAGVDQELGRFLLSQQRTAAIR